jgi:outer membrane protein assembly factor BamB
MKKVLPLLCTLCLISLLGASFLVPQGERLWRFITGGRIRSWPAVGCADTVYCISEDRYLYALNTEGKQLWRLYLEERVSDCFVVGYDGSLYVGLKGGIILAVNPRGLPIWRYDIKGELKYSPAMQRDGTLAVISQQGELAAISHTGFLRWKQTLGGAPADGPVTDGEGAIYVPLEGGLLSALSPWGREKWNIRLRGNPRTPAVAADGTLVVGTGLGLLYSIRTDGHILWELSFDSALSAPVIDNDGNIYVGQGSGTLCRVSGKGELEWKVRLGGSISRSCTLGESGTVYASADNDYLYAVSAGGAIIWSLPVRGNLTHPALSSQGILYAGSDDWSIYALKAEKPADSAWPQYRHDSRHTGRSTRAVDTRSINERYGTNPDFLYFKGLLLSDNPGLMEKGLTEIRRRYDHYLLKEDGVYLFYLLGLVAGGSLSEENKKYSYPSNGYSTIRAQACELYTLIGGFYARDLLLRLVRDDGDAGMKAEAVHCLGMLQSDPQGDAVHAIFSLVRSPGRSGEANSVAREGTAALVKIANYHGNLPAEGIQALLAVAGGNYIDNVKQQAMAALQAIQ